jgi:hypothetical protein
MMTENPRCAVRLRNHHDQGIEKMIRQKKIEELTFEDCIKARLPTLSELTLMRGQRSGRLCLGLMATRLEVERRAR